jgi:hypothetical protein
MSDRFHQEYLRACRTAFESTPEVCSKTLLLGEDNPISAAPEHALFPLPAGCAGERLCNKILGVGRATYLATWRTNLCVGGWSTARARERARALIHGSPPWTVIVLLGRKVAEEFEHVIKDAGHKIDLSAFRIADVPSVEDVPPLKLVSIPHPSGRNRIWNEFKYCESARLLLEEAAPGYPVGEAL